MPHKAMSLPLQFGIIYIALSQSIFYFIIIHKFMHVMQGDIGIEGPRGGVGQKGKTVSSKSI